MDYNDVLDREEYPRNAPADDSDDFGIPIVLRKVVVLQPFLSSYQEGLLVKDPIACIAKPFPDIQENIPESSPGIDFHSAKSVPDIHGGRS